MPGNDITGCLMEVDMKWALRVLGGLLVLVGVLWFLQGINVVMGSMMSGRPEYSLLGVIVAAAGIAMLVFSNRRKV